MTPQLRLIDPTTADADCAAAACVHGAAVATRGDDPWSAETIGRMLTTAGGFGIVVHDGDGGSMVGRPPLLSERRDRQAEAAVWGFVIARAIAGESEILLLAVHPERQRCGFGRALLTAAKRQATASGARRMYLEVGVDNAPAVLLYQSVGFVAVGRRPRYYGRNGAAPVDAEIMRCWLDADAESQHQIE